MSTITDRLAEDAAQIAEERDRLRSALIAISASAVEFRLRERHSGRGPGDAGMRLALDIEEWVSRAGLTQPKVPCDI